MVKRTRFGEYKDRYPTDRFELSDDGILVLQCHTNGGAGTVDDTDHRHGLDRETYARQAFFRFAGAMEPINRVWNEKPWSA